MARSVDRRAPAFNPAPMIPSALMQAMQARRAQQQVGMQAGMQPGMPIGQRSAPYGGATMPPGYGGAPMQPGFGFAPMMAFQQAQAMQARRQAMNGAYGPRQPGYSPGLPVPSMGRLYGDIYRGQRRAPGMASGMGGYGNFLGSVGGYPGGQPRQPQYM